VSRTVSQVMRGRRGDGGWSRIAQSRLAGPNGQLASEWSAQLVSHSDLQAQRVRGLDGPRCLRASLVGRARNGADVHFRQVIRQRAGRLAALPLEIEQGPQAGRVLR
jgi:hypothetical protein